VAFDLNLGKKPVLTIARRFSRENTNERGDQLNIATGTMVIMEFKKYFFLNLIQLRQDFLDKKISMKLTSSALFLTCPFPAPPTIEKAWDLVILYTEHYQEFCQTIFAHLLSLDGRLKGKPSTPAKAAADPPAFWLDKPTRKGPRSTFPTSS